MGHGLVGLVAGLAGGEAIDAVWSDNNGTEITEECASKLAGEFERTVFDIFIFDDNCDITAAGTSIDPGRFISMLPPE